MKDEALRLALDYIIATNKSSTFWLVPQSELNKTVTAIKQALAQPEQDWIERERAVGYREGHQNALKQMAQPESEPVAWLITNEKINILQVDSIQRLIDRAKHAHMTDIKLRINGQDEWYEADWLKHMTRTSPSKREWRWLTDEEIYEAWESIVEEPQQAVQFAYRIQAKLKEKNT